jgi:FKBP-type peptidyl-prolyl cis-trans isomerase 2
VGDEVRLASGTEARVSEVTDDWITIDANHELAGKTLHYDVELLQLTKARCHCPRQAVAGHQTEDSAPANPGCEPLLSRIQAARL